MSENQNNIYSDNNLELKELFSILWKGKWLIGGVTILFSVISVVIALSLPNEYKATAVVIANDSSDSGKLNSLAGKFGGLASLAGVNIGSNESVDSVIALEVIKSWGFAEDFIRKHDISVPLFAGESWDDADDIIILDRDLYDNKSEQWVRSPPRGKTIEPTSWELFDKYRDRLVVNKNEDTGIVTISFTFYSPKLAKQWVDWLVEDINLYMKKNALEKANNSIRYLEEQIALTSYAEIRSVFSELIQEQHKTRMLAQISNEFTFQTIGAAKVPEVKSKPIRWLIVVVATFLGAIFSVFLVLIKNYFYRK